jgi:hypothetical protein
MTVAGSTMCYLMWNALTASISTPIFPVCSTHRVWSLMHIGSWACRSSRPPLGQDHHRRSRHGRASQRPPQTGRRGSISRRGNAGRHDARETGRVHRRQGSVLIGCVEEKTPVFRIREAPRYQWWPLFVDRDDRRDGEMRSLGSGSPPWTTGTPPSTTLLHCRRSGSGSVPGRSTAAAKVDGAVAASFSAAARGAGYRYELSILQAEFCRSQMLDKPVGAAAITCGASAQSGRLRPSAPGSVTGW